MELFNSNEKRRGYVNPETFHRFMNEVVGLKLGKNAMYTELATGKIRALKTGLKSYQIPHSELFAEDGGPGAYETRKLAEAQGRPVAHTGLLGKKISKTPLNG